MAKQSRGIYKRGNIWWVMFADVNGVMRYESTGSRNKKDAANLLTKRRTEILEGKEPSVVKIKDYTFSELVTEYLQFASRQRGFHAKRYLIKQLQDEFGDYKLRNISTQLLEQYQSKRLQKNKPATCNRLIATIAHMMTKATEWDMVSEDVLKKIRKVKMLPENNKRLRYLSKEECQALINACDTHLKPIVITALNTGLRKSNILQLTWDSVDLQHGFIHIPTTKNGERHDIPLNDDLKAVLSGLVRRVDSPYVFYDNHSGKAYGDVKRSFATACKKAGLKDFHFHDLRHTFASHLVMAGVDIATVKELLNHKSLAMTLRYAHLSPTHKVNAVNMLNISTKVVVSVGNS
ncbi:MAG: site-specific integrase [Nitrospirae bacterium]|nr:site-specific integrase [Nitrospirota bacterium]